MRRLFMVSAMCAVLVLGLMPGAALAAASYPTSASGTTNCTGSGSVVLQAGVGRPEGLRVSNHPVGTPVGGWSRTVAPFNANPVVYNTYFNMVSKNANAQWAMSTYVSPSEADVGLYYRGTACTQSAVSGTVIATKSGGAKTCPTGQTVLIVSSGFTPLGHFWTRVGSSTSYHAKQTGVAFLWFLFTDTGANKIGSWTIRAYAGRGTPETPLPEATVTCSAGESITGTVSWP